MAVDIQVVGAEKIHVPSQALRCHCVALGIALRWALLWKLRAAMLTNGGSVFHLSVTAFEALRFPSFFCATQHFRKGPTWIRLRFLQAGVWIAPFWWLTKLTARRSIRSM